MPCDLLLPSLLFPTRAYQQVCWEGASYIIKALEPTPKSVRSFLAPAFGRGSPRAFGVAPPGPSPSLIFLAPVREVMI